MFKKLLLMISLFCGMYVSVNLDYPNRDSFIARVFGREYTQKAWQERIDEVRAIIHKAKLDGDEHRSVTIADSSDSTISWDYETLYQQVVKDYKVYIAHDDNLVHIYDFSELSQFLTEYANDLLLLGFRYSNFSMTITHIAIDVRPYISRADLENTPSRFASNQEYRDSLAQIMAHENEAESDERRLTEILYLFGSQIRDLHDNHTLKQQMKFALYFICTFNLRGIVNVLCKFDRFHALQIDSILYHLKMFYYFNYYNSQIRDDLYDNWHVYCLLYAYYYVARKIVGTGLFNDLI